MSLLLLPRIASAAHRILRMAARHRLRWQAPPPARVYAVSRVRPWPPSAFGGNACRRPPRPTTFHHRFPRMDMATCHRLLAPPPPSFFAPPPKPSRQEDVSEKTTSSSLLNIIKLTFWCFYFNIHYFQFQRLHHQMLIILKEILDMVKENVERDLRQC